MFYPKRDLKTIYAESNAVCVEDILALMNNTNQELEILKQRIANEHITHTKNKLANCQKSEQEIHEHLSSRSFNDQMSAHINYMLNNHIVAHLSNNLHLGEKVKILTSYIRPLKHQQKNSILQGVYKLSLLKEPNDFMRNLNGPDFQSLIEAIIVCSNVKQDITQDKQKELLDIIRLHNKAEEGLSLAKVNDKLHEIVKDLTGFDINKPFDFFKEKLNLGKKKQQEKLSSIDEMIVVSSITTPLTPIFFLFGALTFNLAGLASALLPIFLMIVIGKDIYNIVTEDKNKEGTIHNPFSQGITHQSATNLKSQNYTAVLEQSKKEGRNNKFNLEK